MPWTAEQVVRHARTATALLLTFGFAGWLLWTVASEQPSRGFGRLAPGSGPEADIRVLVTNRAELLDRAPPIPTRTFDQLSVLVLAPFEVVSPDAPEDPDRHAALRAGSTLTLRPDINSGLVLSSQEWGKELHWTVSRLRLEPARRDGPPELIPRGDPRGLETPDRGAAFAIGPRNRYRGSLEVLWVNSKEIAAINHLPMESYLEGVVAVEMSPAYPLEALKAQAIASRGFALAKRWQARAASQPFDLSDCGDDQEYRGTGRDNGLCRRAVAETRGVAPLLRGALFTPFFHASSGGALTSAAAVARGARDVQGRIGLETVMLPGVDPFCEPAARSLGLLSTHWETSAVLRPRDIQREVGKLLQAQGRAIGFIKDLRVGRRDPVSGRVLTVMVHHTQGEPEEIDAHVFRMVVDPRRIRSTLWSPDSPRKVDAADGKGKEYQITCHGWGHGAGMSQISAWEMARLGWTAERILKRFYVGIDLARMW